MLGQPCLVSIRPLQNRDFPQVLNILYENEVHLDHISLNKIKKDRDLVSIVAENSEIITGFAVYDTTKGTEIKSIYVQEDFRRLSVGTQLVNHIKRSSEKRGSIVAVRVTERNLLAQCFFRSQDFKWIKTNKEEFYPDDGYLMLWKK